MYSTAVCVAHGSTDHMATYLPVMMGKVGLIWLEGIATDFQATYTSTGTDGT